MDYLGGHPPAQATLDSYPEKIISRITWMEVLVGAQDASDEATIRAFLTTFRAAELMESISECAVQLRRNATPRLKLPDAIIYATAREKCCSLVTRNTKDIPRALPDVTAPYIR